MVLNSSPHVWTFTFTSWTMWDTKDCINTWRKSVGIELGGSHRFMQKFVDNTMLKVDTKVIFGDINESHLEKYFNN